MPLPFYFKLLGLPVFEVRPIVTMNFKKFFNKKTVVKHPAPNRELNGAPLHLRGEFVSGSSCKTACKKHGLLRFARNDKGRGGEAPKHTLPDGSSNGALTVENPQNNRGLGVGATRPKKPRSFGKYKWIINISVLTLVLSLCFSIFSELIISAAGILISLFIILLLLIINVIADMIGLSFASCPRGKLDEAYKNKVKGSAGAVSLSNNFEKVSSFCSDVVGDICGILSGAAGSAIAIKLTISMSGSVVFLIAALTSACLAAVTVFGKAICKRIAIDNALTVVLLVGRMLSFAEKGDNKVKTKK